MQIEAMEQSAAEAEAMLKLLANRMRLMILCQLVGGEKNVSQLVEAVGLSQSALSQHLAKMREAELVTVERQGKHMIYRLSNPHAEAILQTLYGLYCRVE